MPEKKVIPYAVVVVLLNTHEKEGEWLDHCKTLKLKDQSGKIIGKVANLTPRPDGLHAEFEIFDKHNYWKMLKVGHVEFINTCGNPRFVLNWEDVS
jgi:hypothetical protein